MGTLGTPKVEKLRTSSAGFLSANADIIATFCIFLAYSASSSAYLRVIRADGPSGMTDPHALNRIGTQAFIVDPDSSIRTGRLAKVARRSLQLQALNPGALGLLSISMPTAAKGRVEAARALTLSTSRRELLSHLIVIEDWASAGDTKGVLENCDMALKTSLEAQQLLFPVMTKAIEDPVIRNAIAPYISKQASWAPNFTQFVLGQPRQVVYLSDKVFRAGGLGAMGISHGLTNQPATALMNQGRFDLAKRQYPLANPRNEPLFVSAPSSPANFSKKAGPFGWELSEQPDFGATRVSDGGLDLYALPRAKGVAARKFLFLAPVQYRLVAQDVASNSINQSARTFLITCSRSDTSALIFDSAASKGAVKGNRTEWSVAIPDGCNMQTLPIMAVGGDSQGNVQIRLPSLGLFKV